MPKNVAKIVFQHWSLNGWEGAIAYEANVHLELELNVVVNWGAWIAEWSSLSTTINIGMLRPGP